MDAILQNGTIVKTTDGITVTVEKLLGEGGQGWVYQVLYGSERKAMKWYKRSGLGRDPEGFYSHIETIVRRPVPSSEFLWPTAVTLWYNDAFGYIMDLVPKGYYEMTYYLLGKVRFPTFRAAVDASLHIVSAFRILHSAGLCYQDMNNGNFFIEPATGNVLIGDNDNVAPIDSKFIIPGKPRYMAPEIVRELIRHRKEPGGAWEVRPNQLSDRYSMAQILYMLLCLNHPLEGKRYLQPAFTQEMQDALYGTDPVFMMDPNDARNAPDPTAHRNSVLMWKCLPDYLRAAFERTFSRKALMENPAYRLKEVDWLQVLTRFRSEIVSCSNPKCGREVLVQNGVPQKCGRCGTMLRIPCRLELWNYSVPVVRDARIFRCQLGTCDTAKALDVVAVVEEQSGCYGIRNKSERDWNVRTLSGGTKRVAPGEAVPALPGLSFTYDGNEIKILKN
ncbi:MAG: hypothetical protein ACI4PH_08870 [Faecousia sp.]